MPRPRTTVPRPLAVLLVALPPLFVGAVGTQHPLFLTPATAHAWQTSHLLLLPGFPLLAVSLWAVLRGIRTRVADLSRLLAAAYAVLYGALDSIAGIGAPHQVLGTVHRHEPLPPIGDLYEIGDRIGHLGVWALALASLVAAGVLFARGRDLRVLVGGAVAAASCYPFYLHHVFPPQGVLAMVGLAAGFALLEAGRGARLTG